ncbi:root hair defective 3 GTP-binding protein [Tilletiaria anomala UBC 951]|uniref:Root hair defective 3 GTP-binding protein n=1 Tax=Tilletiaria anomala (strain ATCC 24038 / CBS 436.72 / UBC 951) TaxID=1037660 RepID=A0A066V3D8_TILAU|nr:root hair defective 3 GTP-binding protein [Tilletiaria anomala UBC 951]KDN35946.1 root hair defective 3 GTP-binding protein [Tilletiaria anomala UBC 951]
MLPLSHSLGAGGAGPAGSSSSSKHAQRLQLIDEAQQFHPQMTAYLESWGLHNVGFGYDLCAVLGSQSTGKSTLLNKLFGTNFDVMDETQRRQTTKGIWLSRGANMPVLVMDVEGTDGRERGEDQDFERKSALFSMASAEVLIVNMWEHQVGLYQGANMGLLKTVFEVNLGLFQSSKQKNSGLKDKTLLLFVIRDHIGATPLQNLQNTLLADLGRIWESLAKPEGMESSNITEFFDFSFTTLPHKLLQPKEFDDQVLALRQRFTDSKHPGFIFKTQYHKRIPADGLPHYLANIWEQVVSNKDLDLPTQQELLAQFRCDEIANVAFAQFTSDIRAFRRPIEAGEVLETLGGDMAAHCQTALAVFDKDASRYHSEVYKRKRQELLDKLHSALSPFVLGQLKNLHKRVLAHFKRTLLENLRGDGHDFGEVVRVERAKAETAFAAAAALLMLDGTDWNTAEEEAQLREDIQQIADQCRVEETKKMIVLIERSIKRAVAEPTEIALGKPGPEMWDHVLEGFRHALQQAEAAYMQKAKSFNCTEEENSIALRSLRQKAWQSLRAKVDEITADSILAARLRNIFEDGFRYDEYGTPRIWKPEDDIDGIFRKARDETLELIPIYARIEPKDESLLPSIPSSADDPEQAAAVARGEEDEFNFGASLVVFSETRKADIGTRFRKEADAYYVEAKRSTVSSIAQVPYWIYGVMLLLGWNEIIAVIRSPMYFTFLLLCAGAAYVVWRLNLQGPLQAVVTAILREVHRLADEQLRAHFSQPLLQPSMLKEEPVPASLSRPTPSEAAPEEIELKEKIL